MNSSFERLLSSFESSSGSLHAVMLRLVPVDVGASLEDAHEGLRVTARCGKEVLYGNRGVLGHCEHKHDVFVYVLIDKDETHLKNDRKELYVLLRVLIVTVEKCSLGRGRSHRWVRNIFCCRNSSCLD